MIEFERVTFTYDGSEAPVLSGVDLTIPEGSLALVIGPTGSGKSTLLGAVNGLVPHFSGGLLEGRVAVAGLDTRTHKPRQLAATVGVVGQDPAASFVTDTVEEELAYVMEQLSVDPAVMRKRVEETLDLLGIADLRDRPLAQLSGGQQQRVAIGAVLTAHPRVLVLDEPTSALDPTAAEEVLASITRLVHDLGITVMLAEHRLERVVQYADTVVEIGSSGRVHAGPPAEVMAVSSVAPPVVELGRLAGWSPLPMSVRDARRRAGPLRESLAPLAPPADRRPADRRPEPTTEILEAKGVVVRYQHQVAVKAAGLALGAGTVTALMGRNGAGKSSLLLAIQGAGPRQAGRVSVGREDPAALPARRARRLVALVPQSAADLLYLHSVGEELAQADRDAVEPTAAAGPAGTPETARSILDRLAPGIADAIHPRDLSEGQRLALVLAIQLRSSPAVVLLDEPTRGLDYVAKRSLARSLTRLAAAGRAVLVSSHDVEFVAAVADRVLVMADGEIVAAGPAGEILAASPAFAPQVAKVLAPLGYLTVEAVRSALARAES